MVRLNPYPGLCTMLSGIQISGFIFIGGGYGIDSFFGFSYFVGEWCTKGEYGTIFCGSTPKSRVKNLVEWVLPEQDELKSGICLKIHFKMEAVLKFVTWHYKGDYFATVCPQGNRSAVLIHQLSRQQTQNPFTKSKGIVQCVRFHPSKPYFFVATQRHIRIYNLAQQKLQKKLLTGSRWISSIHVHSGGDNIIMGSFDRRVCWFDLDLGTKPYKVLRYHKQAVRATKFHSRYPLFASCSDDGYIHVFHGMVYNDFLQNAFIVPLKVLRGHDVINDMGVLDIVFHPFQPWIFSSGVDGTIRLYI